MRILMVCLGNICRSPLAEGILRQNLMNAGITAKVDSAGTASYHVDEPPDPRSVETGLKYGINISHQRARAFKQSDFNDFDLILAMDRENYRNIMAKASGPGDKSKVKLIGHWIDPVNMPDVPDPYYGGRDGFEKVYRMLDQACKRLIRDGDVTANSETN